MKFLTSANALKKPIRESSEGIHVYESSIPFARLEPQHQRLAVTAAVISLAVTRSGATEPKTLLFLLRKRYYSSWGLIWIDKSRGTKVL